MAEITTHGDSAPDEPESLLTGPTALLDNIRSAWNVGSIFRSAEGFGFRHLYLCGITPTPVHEQVQKTALGAETQVLWSSHPNAVLLLQDLKGRGYSIWVLERTTDSQPLGNFLKEAGDTTRVILVVGNENAGVDPDILALADRVLHIEMMGRKRSFNVAVAFSVAAYALKSP